MQLKTILIFLIFSYHASNCQGILTYRNGTISSENKTLKNAQLKSKINEIGSEEVKEAYRKYRRFHAMKRIILATETVFVLGATDYDTGFPRLNITTLSVGLAAAAVDIILTKPLRRRANRFVEEYNFEIKDRQMLMKQ
ncbi:hypothetical protein [Lacihabitans soyangensis]|uniref:Uncharacterized protein n=1 Tax=Lacihabitans soyangensis TaxID=869394 RepID=A0AAE3H734_9BACT|nr:hypothetical protein [Lacihabitans soyangensis]MCP9765627.1 hypothetical protein [Lacihabitans soyangensis]